MSEKRDFKFSFIKVIVTAVILLATFSCGESPRAPAPAGGGTAPVGGGAASVGGSVAPASPGGAVVPEAKPTVDVILTKYDTNKKIMMIKIVREITGLGLKDTKDLVEKAPQLVKAGVTREEADAIKAKLEKEGATVELSQSGKSINLPALAPTGTGAAVPAPAGTKVDVVLTKFDTNKKIMTIKIIREITGLGLKDAKDMVEQAPQVVKSGVPRDEAEAMKAKLEKEGATVELK